MSAMKNGRPALKISLPPPKPGTDSYALLDESDEELPQSPVDKIFDPQTTPEGVARNSAEPNAETPAPNNQSTAEEDPTPASKPETQTAPRSSENSTSSPSEGTSEPSGPSPPSGHTVEEAPVVQETGLDGPSAQGTSTGEGAKPGPTPNPSDESQTLAKTQAVQSAPTPNETLDNARAGVTDQPAAPSGSGVQEDDVHGRNVTSQSEVTIDQPRSEATRVEPTAARSAKRRTSQERTSVASPTPVNKETGQPEPSGTSATQSDTVRDTLPAIELATITQRPSVSGTPPGVTIPGAILSEEPVRKSPLPAGKKKNKKQYSVRFDVELSPKEEKQYKEGVKRRPTRFERPPLHLTQDDDDSDKDSVNEDADNTDTIPKRKATGFVPVTNPQRRPTGFKRPPVEEDALSDAGSAGSRSTVNEFSDEENNDDGYFVNDDQSPLLEDDPNATPKHKKSQLKKGPQGGEVLGNNPRGNNKEGEEEEEELAKWDVFQTVPRGDDDNTWQVIYEIVRKIFRITTLIFTFLLIGAGTLFHKATILLATSQLRAENFTYKCNLFEDLTKNDTYPMRCVRTRTNWTSESMSCIGIRPNEANKTLDFEGEVCEAVTVRWIWCLLLMIVTPEVFVFFRNFWNICFKTRPNPTKRAFFTVMISETLAMIGVCAFAFVVLPSLGVLHGVGLMAGVGFVPSLLNVFNRPEDEGCCRPMFMMLDLLAMFGQLSALVVWPVLIGLGILDLERHLMYFIPGSLLLISFYWWPNYIDGASRLGCLSEPLTRLKKEIRKQRTKIYFFVCIWKMGVAILCMMLFNSGRMSVPELFNFEYKDRCKGEHQIGIIQIPGLEMDWVYVWLVHMGSGFVCYFCARAAVKVLLQFVSYAIPLTLVTPTLLAAFIGVCRNWQNDQCYFASFMPEYLTFTCPVVEPDLLSLVTVDHLYMIYIWWLSQIWVSNHVWSQTKETKLAKTATFFFAPLYNGVFLEEWFLYNRCRKEEGQSTGYTIYMREKDREKKQKSKQNEMIEEEYGAGDRERERLRKERLQDQVPIIYICATMWHETAAEMNMMLKSIFKLDIDQFSRRKAQEYLNEPDPDFYNFEAHIFFDDAMDRSPPHTKYNYVPNSYVKLLVKTMDEAAKKIFQTNASVIDPPRRFPTPYGGRLVWTLPGGNQVIAHLKDKDKIRPKKRWSQVMYMYYFLGFKLFMSENLSKRRKQVRADHTFLLALDGDVDFEPIALRLLVDIMRKDIKIGAACGRIHPVGSGPMVWYQKFEYALGHWMQKATEHVLGCVLCSPGCFSLFRGSALMDDNVMNQYTVRATEARHFVQYDQGEDRWLCTLLLQQGYRVEYSAASDSFTFAPEVFDEFYNQRRRWTPSTMANIMDLLESASHTVKVNENISMLYIIYQGSIFISSLLGLGTIFLMIVGALAVAVGIDDWTSFFINLVPVFFFMILCFKAPSNIQTTVATLMTVAYALIQMMVLVAILISMSKEGTGSPTFIFFVYVAGTFLLAAILHPQEFFCVVHGLLYFLLVPSMYMLLMMYSITNLHVVSWGTREVKQTKTQKEEEEEREALEQAKKDAKEKEAQGLLSQMMASVKSKMSSKDKDGKTDGWNVQLGGLCKFMCCPRPVPEDTTKYDRITDLLRDHKDMMNDLRRAQNEQRTMLSKLGIKVDILAQENTEYRAEMIEAEYQSREEESSSNFRQQATRRMSRVAEVHMIADDAEEEKKGKKEEEVKKELQIPEEEKEVDELNCPRWIDDPELGGGIRGKLNTSEIEFFQGLIKKYLYPLIKDKKQEEKVGQDLLDLRDKMAFGYYLMNAIFIVVIFTLQRHTDVLSIKWPLGDNLRLEPIGLMFLIFFAIIMFLQTVGMLAHRLGTFLHLVADTSIFYWFDDDSPMKTIVQMTKNFNYAPPEEDDSDETSSVVSEFDDFGEDAPKPRHRKTVYKLDRTFTKGPDRRKTVIRMDDIVDKKYREWEETKPEEAARKLTTSSVMHRMSTAAIAFFQQKRRSLDQNYDDSNSSSSAPGYPDINPNHRFSPRDRHDRPSVFDTTSAFAQSTIGIIEASAEGKDEDSRRLILNKKDELVHSLDDRTRSTSVYSLSPDVDYEEDPDTPPTVRYMDSPVPEIDPIPTVIYRPQVVSTPVTFMDESAPDDPVQRGAPLEETKPPTYPLKWTSEPSPEPRVPFQDYSKGGPRSQEPQVYKEPEGRGAPVSDMFYPKPPPIITEPDVRKVSQPDYVNRKDGPLIDLTPSSPRPQHDVPPPDYEARSSPKPTHIPPADYKADPNTNNLDPVPDYDAEPPADYGDDPLPKMSTVVPPEDYDDTTSDTSGRDRAANPRFGNVYSKLNGTALPPVDYSNSSRALRGKDRGNIEMDLFRRN